MSLTARLPIAFTAQSKREFHCRNAVCVFVINHGFIPLNPFRCFDYFLSDRVSRYRVRQANNNLIRVADELWVFGYEIADGVHAEIDYALDLDKPIRFFSISSYPDEIEEYGDESFVSLVPETGSLIDNEAFELTKRRLGKRAEAPKPVSSTKSDFRFYASLESKPSELPDCDHEWGQALPIKEEMFQVTVGYLEVCSKCRCRRYENICETRASGGARVIFPPE